MADTEFRQRLAALQTRLAINKARVLSNPEPYLNDMSRRCNELLKVLEDVDYALSPDSVCDWAMSREPPMRPMDVQGEAHIRCQAALKVLREYRST